MLNFNIRPLLYRLKSITNFFYFRDFLIENVESIINFLILDLQS